MNTTKSVHKGEVQRTPKLQPSQPVSSLSSPYLVAVQLSPPETAAVPMGQAAGCHSTANGHVSCAEMRVPLRLTQ